MSPTTRTLLAALTLIAAATTTARADHSQTERATDDAPYILRPGEARVGLAKTELGLFGHPVLRHIQVGTDHLPWFLALAGLRTYNVHGSVLLYQGDRLALGAGVGHTFVGIDAGESPVSVRVTPVELTAGFQISRRLTLTSNVVHTDVDVRGVMEDTVEIDELWGAVGSSTTHVRAGLELRVTNHTALRLGARVVAAQELRAAAGASEDVGMDTRVDGSATVKSRIMDMRGDVTGSAAVHWSWAHFNLELGVEYGTVSVPGVNLALPVRTFMPKFDMYWRF